MCIREYVLRKRQVSWLITYELATILLEQISDNPALMRHVATVQCNQPATGLKGALCYSQQFCNIFIVQMMEHSHCQYKIESAQIRTIILTYCALIKRCTRPKSFFGILNIVWIIVNSHIFDIGQEFENSGGTTSDIQNSHTI